MDIVEEGVEEPETITEETEEFVLTEEVPDRDGKMNPQEMRRRSS